MLTTSAFLQRNYKILQRSKSFYTYIVYWMLSSFLSEKLQNFRKRKNNHIYNQHDCDT